MSQEAYPSNIVPANAFQHVTLSGAASTDIHLTRANPKRNKFVIFECRDRPVPSRPRSQLPPPGSLKLSLRLGKRLGHGAAGRVYEAIVQSDDSSPELRDMVMPNLVVKLSRRDKAKGVEREGYYYQEMEALQGSIVPRYYGLYTTEISPDCGFKPWSRDPIRRAPRSRKTDDKSDVIQQDQESKKGASSWTLNILVLERVGEYLSFERNRTKELCANLEDAFGHLAALGIDHDDVRYQNILRAPSGPGSLPSLPSPWTHDVYEWRIVDFHSATKTNLGFTLLSSKYNQLLDILFWNLPLDFATKQPAIA